MKRLKVILPYVVIPVTVPFYQIVDGALLVNIFGCGCVPSTQTNMLDIPFNANDLRWCVFGMLTILMTALGRRMSRNWKSPAGKSVYCGTIFLVNAVLTVLISKIFMWA